MYSTHYFVIINDANAASVGLVVGKLQDFIVNAEYCSNDIHCIPVCST